jgi:glycosyltransferase involved in cell wall biosynthesis
MSSAAATEDASSGDSMPLPRDLAQWMAKWSSRNGRAPRILHIGNIANNAYNNAKLLIRAGFECHVICYDYYHIMGCPEWEDADFDEPLDYHFSPDWAAVNTNGFERQRWFVQGPMRNCLEYLLSLHAGNHKLADEQWAELAYLNRTTKEFPRHDELWAKIRITRQRWQNNVLHALTSDRVPEQIARTTTNAKKRVRRFFLPSLVPTDSRPLLTFAVTLAEGLLSFLGWVLTGSWHLFLRTARPAARWLWRKWLRTRVSASAFFDRNIIERYDRAFPDRSDRLQPEDLISYRQYAGQWEQLFLHYDIIVGYSVDPILPLLANKPYFALEHGTLREIPFKQDRQGRTTALSYHLAEHVFVTNFDCISNAKTLCGERYSFINHPYDEDHGMRISGAPELRQRLCAELDANFLFFFPTRQDWVVGTGYADKANDVFVRAFVALRKAGHSVGVVCCEWGKNVEQTKALFRDHGAESYVRWEPPMSVIKFERHCRASDVVVDQFKLGAFGGVTFKALAVGVPVCAFLDVEALGDLYTVMPPVINCDSEQKIVEKLAPLIENEQALRELGSESRQWIERHHSGRDTVISQMTQFRVLYPEIVEEVR